MTYIDTEEPKHGTIGHEIKELVDKYSNIDGGDGILEQALIRTRHKLGMHPLFIMRSYAETSEVMRMAGM